MVPGFRVPGWQLLGKRKRGRYVHVAARGAALDLEFIQEHRQLEHGPLNNQIALLKLQAESLV
jgi:hypothetical protein